MLGYTTSTVSNQLHMAPGLLLLGLTPHALPELTALFLPLAAWTLASGDSLTVFDGRGGEYEAVIQRIERDRVDVKLGAWRDVDRESALEVGLVQGLPEADKMDWIIQKATELGVAWIQPVTCERSVVRLSGERAVYGNSWTSPGSLPNGCSRAPAAPSSFAV